MLQHSVQVVVGRWHTADQRGRSQTTFGPLLTANPPPVDICEGIPLNTEIIENMHTVHIPVSLIYLVFQRSL